LTLLTNLRNWRRKRLLVRAQLPALAWQRTLNELPVLAGLSAAERERLRELVILFLAEKTFIAKGELELDDTLRLVIAAQACLPILYLDLDYYRGWRSIIVYPEGFVSPREYQDQAGVVHSYHSALVGEAWDRGPLVLSWHDVLASGGGFNVVIHECAHKLDMLNGDVNGFPPLHTNMAPERWSRLFSAAYDDFCRQVDAGIDTALDPYAAESPGEFFAVVSEAFFEIPGLLSATYPPVYHQLRAFYRQDPVARPHAGRL
jgi:hypothetical protein